MKKFSFLLFIVFLFTGLTYGQEKTETTKTKTSTTTTSTTDKSGGSGGDVTKGKSRGTSGDVTKGKSRGGSGDVTKGKSRGADPNIKIAEQLNSDEMETNAIQPIEKGAASTRGSGPGTVYVTFDNFTNWYVYCYVDGGYVGTVAPYGTIRVTTGSRTTCLYAKADFDNGDKRWWGSKCMSVDPNDRFKMEIHQTTYNWYIN